MLTVPPMPQERIASWGARDETSARRIERAVRPTGFGFANRRSSAEEIVKTDGDSPFGHVLLACSLKHEDRPQAMRAKEKAIERISHIPTKRAKLIASALSTFLPAPGEWWLAN